MTELKCPIHNTKLAYLDESVYGHTGCHMTGNKELWQALIDAKKKLDIALQAFRTLSQITSRLDESYYIDDIIKELEQGEIK